MTTTYFKGDKAEYTGNVLQIHGGMFYEVLMLEGIYKGQTKVVKTPPRSVCQFGECGAKRCNGCGVAL